VLAWVERGLHVSAGNPNIKVRVRILKRKGPSVRPNRADDPKLPPLSIRLMPAPFILGTIALGARLQDSASLKAGSSSVENGQKPGLLKTPCEK
jgi:hypothetical protein